MLTSFLCGEGSFAYKGYNNPFGIWGLTVYLAGSNMLPDHVEQSSLTLLHEIEIFQHY